MLLLVLKSSACLAVFMLFYKLFLEKESVHVFKRFYLLGVILISIIIPFITFTEYVEVTQTDTYIALESFEAILVGNSEDRDWKDEAIMTLWIIYIIGTFIFGIRFAKNLNDIIGKIRSNPKHKYQSFINVLLNDLIPPHTFFNYIFLNKTKFENQLIPKEVLLHEQTHAKQKHAMDILFIEVLQVIFWFNPLIYLIKKDVKLNHEFLADHAVLKTGISSSTYKETLLAFSSGATEPQLANAINYSSIKKRFTVMKTQTSKSSFRIRSFIILPILAVLIYSFSEKKIITKGEEASIIDTYNDISKIDIRIFIDEKGHVFLNDKLCDINDLKLSLLNLKERLSASEKENLIAFLKIEHNNNEDIFLQVNKVIKLLESLKIKAANASEVNFATSLPPVQQKISAEELIEYNTIVKKLNAYIKEKKDEALDPETFNRLLYLKSLLGNEEKNAEKLLIPIDQPPSLSEPLLILINKNGKLLVNDHAVQIDHLKTHLEKLIKEKGKITNAYIKFDSEAPKEIINKTKNILRESGILKINVTNQQGKATPEQLAEYNTIVMKVMSQPEGKRIFKQRDVTRITYLYSLMSKEQKEKYAASFPKFPPPPPPKEPEIIEIKEVPPPKPLKSKKRIKKDVKTIEVQEVPGPLKSKEPEIIEIQEVPPPPPPIISIGRNAKDLEPLYNAKVAYLEKSNAYGKAVNNYLKLKSGNTDQLNDMYKKTMVLYKKYTDLAKKEAMRTSPPPPPPPTKSSQSIKIKEVPQQQIKYNTLKVPKGGEYMLVLHDGTKIHIKSESQLKYPVLFTKGQTRKVELNGEAYFEVAESDEYSNPSFVVVANGKEINVSGKKTIKK